MYNINIDLSCLAGFKDLADIIKQEAEQAANDLSIQVHAKALELANERLHSRRQMFVEALSLTHEGNGEHYLSLAQGSVWIDDGMEPHSMLDALLNSPSAKTSKDGHKYLVVPFQHVGPGKGPTNTPESSKETVDTVRAELKKRKIPLAKIERDAQGRPKMGKIHSFNIEDKPLKSGEGPGQGHGPVGGVKQGKTGIPFLRGVSVYQSATPSGGTKKSVLTFRVATSKNPDGFFHPGLQPVHIFDSVYAWALEEVESHITPDLIERIASKI